MKKLMVVILMVGVLMTVVAAPDKPGDKTTKLTEFPWEITAAEWDKLPGKVIKVPADSQKDIQKFTEGITIKRGEVFYAVPHPTDKWNITRTISCTWEGKDKGYAGRMQGELVKENGGSGFPMKTILIGPMVVRFFAQRTMEYGIYYSGFIRVKLVPAIEEQ